jgi:magnesium-transporting ATPase (P-type)
MCSTKLDSFNQAANFDGQGYDGQDYLERVITNDIIVGNIDAAVHAEDANTGLKALTIAYRDFDTNSFEGMKAAHNNFEDEHTRNLIESDLTLVASVGLSDPMREGI